MATDFLKPDGQTPTDEGARVIQWVKELLAEAEKDKVPDKINALPGMVKHFYINVVKLKALTEAQWLRDYPNSATAALELLTEAESAKNEAEAEAQARNERDQKIDDQLKKLTEELDKANKQIKALQESQPANAGADDKKKKKDDAGAGGAEEGK